MNSRLDLIIVWPHGMESIDYILEEIRKFDFELLYFKLYTPVNMDDFIDMVYSFDTFPEAHLREKNKHLYELEGSSVYIILVKNNKPDEKEVGHGEYKHLQCSYINDFKWKIRTKLNPYVNNEMTHQHVIHTTDYESQVIGIWNKLLYFPIINDLSKKNTYFSYLPYYLSNFSNGFKVCKVSVNRLLCLEARDDNNVVVPLRESVFAKYVNGDKQPYIDYWNHFKGRILEYDYTPSKFDEMINNFEYRNLIVIHEDGIIVDGNHRASIYKDEEITSIVIPKND